MTKRAAKAKKNSGKSGTAKGTGTTKMNSAGGGAGGKEREAAEKVAAAIKKINADLKELQGPEWDDE